MTEFDCVPPAAWPGRADPEPVPALGRLHDPAPRVGRVSTSAEAPPADGGHGPEGRSVTQDRGHRQMGEGGRFVRVVINVMDE